jgi:hypothetical protein
MVGLGSVGLVLACGNNTTGETGTEIPGRGTSSGNNGEGGTSSGTTTSSGGPDCTNRPGKVSDTPACDTCAKAKCCEHIDACDNNDDCKAAQDCIAACDPSDQVCGLTCLLAHEEGTGILQKLASCTSSKCKAECPSASVDASDDGSF